MGKVYGITGGIASGKSLAGKLLEEWFEVSDADSVVHKLYRENNEIRGVFLKAFGPEVLFNGEIDRDYLRELVFSPKKEHLLKLNSIVKPFIEEALLEEIKRLRKANEVSLVQIPLLFENGWEKKLDGVLLIGCGGETQVKRVMKRDKCSRTEANAIISNQLNYERKAKVASWIILNNDDEKTLKTKLTAWAKEVGNEN